MDKESIRAFKGTYHRCGKYNLKVQIPHLAKLADYYHQKYRETKHWTDCLKAHTLYNSVYTRTNGDETFQERAFNLQTEYWGENSNLSFSDQQKITHDLLGELETIRVRYREEIKSMDQLVKHFEDDNVQPGVRQEFYGMMKSISLSCSQIMGKFAGSIIRESVQLLNITPPCDFDAVAFGSIARGEATPYSDLEYLFLVEKKTMETIQYFEILALTSYFLVGNLAETKLSYVAIEELQGWFHDTSKNGFKIDGLLEGAGNIPTGNGSEVKHNHFIVTPQELADRYQHILHNPDPTESLRGDLTAMLSYTTTLYSHSADGVSGKLLLEFREQQAAIKPNQAREDANFKMLTTDANKFNFVPDGRLQAKGFSADVKKELYRFPSILSLDIGIVCGCTAQSSWESLELLREKNKISPDICESLKLLLAAATYIRLSAYLYHDSHDDRLSLAQQGNVLMKQSQNRGNSQISKRWFLPPGLFATMCAVTMPLKTSLANKNLKVGHLLDLQFKPNNWWTGVTTMYYTGRYGKALCFLKDECPHLTEEVVGSALVIVNISGTGILQTMIIISETLFFCHETTAALQLYDYMTEYGIGDMRSESAKCYHQLGDYQSAIAILESIESMSSGDLYSLGQAYISVKRFSEAEESLLQALQINYNKVTTDEAVADYYGSPLESQTTKIEQSRIKLEVMSPEERLHVIREASPSIIHCLEMLARVFSATERYQLALAYHKKALQCTYELYGEEAAVVEIGSILNNLSATYNSMKQYKNSEECLVKALSIYRQLPLGVDMANTLSNLGQTYHKALKTNWIRAEAYYKEALEIYTTLNPNHPNISEAQRVLSEVTDVLSSLQPASEKATRLTTSPTETVSRSPTAAPPGSDMTAIADLTNLGNVCSKQGDYDEGLKYYKKSLQTIDELYGKGAAVLAKAKTLNNVGNNYKMMERYAEAEQSYCEAISIYSRLPECLHMANALYNLAVLYHFKTKNINKAVRYYKQAVDIYTRIDPDNQVLRKLKIRLSELEHTTQPQTDSDAVLVGSKHHTNSQLNRFLKILLTTAWKIWLDLI